MSIEENGKKIELIDKNQVPEHLKDIQFIDDLLKEGESLVVGYIPSYGIQGFYFTEILINHSMKDNESMKMK